MIKGKSSRRKVAGHICLVSMSIWSVGAVTGCGNTGLKGKKANSDTNAQSENASPAPGPAVTPRPLPAPSVPPEAVAKNGPTPAPQSAPKPPPVFPNSPPNVPTLDIPALVGQMTWRPRYFNNKTNKIFTGYDGTNKFRVLIEFGVIGILPATVILNPLQLQMVYTSPAYLAASTERVSKIKFTADPTLVTTTVFQTAPQGIVYELTSLKAGTATATGTFESASAPLEIQVAAYTPEQVAAGKRRYLNSITTPEASPACASCHITPDGPNHSPYLMSQFSETGLLGSVETGLNSDDGYRLGIPHMMKFTDATERAGIIPYLRSLDPKLLPEEQSKTFTDLSEFGLRSSSF